MTRSPARTIVLVLCSLACFACDASLPEPESPGAVLYAEHCRGCHRLYAPGVLKPEMWRLMVDRMQGEMVRRGAPPLTSEERRILLSYLERHGGS